MTGLTCKCGVVINNVKYDAVQVATYARLLVSAGVLDIRSFVQSLSPDVRLLRLRSVVAASIEHPLSINDLRLCAETDNLQM